MGTLDLSEFRAEVRFDLKNRPDTASSGFSDSRLNLFINSAYLHIGHPSVFRHRTLFVQFPVPLIANINSYTFVPDPGTGTLLTTAIRSVFYAAAPADGPTVRHTKVKPVDTQWFDDRQLSTGGDPRRYAVEGNSLLVDPVPGPNEDTNVLMVRAVVEPARLVNNADKTVFDNVFDEVVLLGARWRAELHMGYRAMAEATKLDMATLINEYEDFETLHGKEEWDWVPQLRVGEYQETA